MSSLAPDLKRKKPVRDSVAWRALDYLKEVAAAHPDDRYVPDRPLSASERERYPWASKRKSLAEVAGAKCAIRLAWLDNQHGYKFDHRVEAKTKRNLYCYLGEGRPRRLDPSVERRLVVFPKECVALLLVLEAFRAKFPERWKDLGLARVMKKLEAVKEEVYNQPAEAQRERRDLV